MADVILKNISKSYNNIEAVKNISMTIDNGELFGLIEPDGAGKTTAMRMLCGLSKPTSGEATVAGYDVYKQTEQIKKNIGYMSQKFSLYEDLTVLENIVFFGGIYGLSDKRIKYKSEELIQTLGLHNEAKTCPFSAIRMETETIIFCSNYS